MDIFAIESGILRPGDPLRTGTRDGFCSASVRSLGLLDRVEQNHDFNGRAGSLAAGADKILVGICWLASRHSRAAHGSCAQWPLCGANAEVHSSHRLWVVPSPWLYSTSTLRCRERFFKSRALRVSAPPCHFPAKSGSHARRRREICHWTLKTLGESWLHAAMNKDPPHNSSLAWAAATAQLPKR